MKPTKKRCLFVRMDKIGDLVLSLGVDQHPGLAQREITWLVPKGLEFVLQASYPERRFVSWDKAYSKANSTELVEFLKKESFDECVFFQGEKWVIRSLHKAKIPLRVGPYSGLLSCWAFNSGVRQRRSQVKMSEFMYNQDLIERALKLSPLGSALDPTVLVAKSTFSLNLDKAYYVVHAGMGGSALNWSQESYIKAIDLLLSKDCLVVLTGTSGDMEYLDRILNHFSREENLINCVGKLSGDELLAVLNKAEALLAPSTGVLHLAASLGVKTLGLYPPVRVQSFARWGAYGENVTHLSPEVKCPETYKCRGDVCPFYPCMETISPERVIGELSS